MCKIFSRLLTGLALVSALTLFSSTAIAEEYTEKYTGEKTSIELAEFGIEAYEDDWQYSYGGYGSMGYGGTRYSDCSGLIYAYLCWTGENSNPSPNYSMPRAVLPQVYASSQSGPISTMPRTHGLLLTSYDYNHIGIYIGNGQSVDNSTYGTNMIMGDMDNRGWLEWHKLDVIEYPTNGWYEFNGNDYYYIDGEYVIDTELTLLGTTYKFDSAGLSTITELKEVVVNPVFELNISLN